MASFHFELVSPDKLVFSGQAESVLVPGGEGDFVVLKDHAPVMASLRPGVVAYEDAHGKQTRIFVRGGFADVSAAGLILLAETAIPGDQVERVEGDEVGEMPMAAGQRRVFIQQQCTVRSGVETAELLRARGPSG